MFDNIISIIVIVISTTTIIVCSIGIIIATMFQKKQTKKYNEVKKFINENKKARFRVRDGLSKDEISKINNNIDIDILVNELYNNYIVLENKIKNLDKDLDNLLTEPLKNIYINKIEFFKNNKILEVVDDINMIGYSITEYSETNIKLRFNISCFSYKINNKIVSVSNLEKIEKILLITYEKYNENWLINKIEKLYEKKLS